MPKNKNKVVENPKVKKEKRMRKFKIIKNIMKTIILIGILIAGIVFALTSPLFNISNIQVTGNQKNSTDTYISLSGLKTEDNIFNFKKADVIEKIKKNAYVDSVKVQRKLPNTVEITINEREAKFLLKTEDNRYAYISEDGYILEISSVKNSLTSLTGISTDTSNIKTGAKLSDDDTSKLKDITQILNAITSNGIEQTIDSIDVTSRFNYKLTMEKEAKEVVIGDTSDLGTKMLYMKYILNEQEGVPGTIYLENSKVYFSPK